MGVQFGGFAGIGPFPPGWSPVPVAIPKLDRDERLLKMLAPFYPTAESRRSRNKRKRERRERRGK